MRQELGSPAVHKWLMDRRVHLTYSHSQPIPLESSISPKSVFHLAESDL